MSKQYNKDDLFVLINDREPVIDFAMLYPLVKDADAEVRLFVAELLARDNSLIGENALIYLLKDEDELVRAEASDSLSYYSGKNVLNALMLVLTSDESEIVRSYASMSYWDAIWASNDPPSREELASIFNKLFESEKSLSVRLHYAALQYLCGNLDMLDFILREVNNSDHYIRNDAISNIIKISNEENIHLLQEMVRPYYELESVGFVRRKMEAILTYTDDMLDMFK